MYRNIAFLLILVLSVTSSGCLFGSKMTLDIGGTNIAATDGATLLSASCSDSEATIRWACSQGSLDTNKGKDVIWIAPSSPGTYIVTATASSSSKSVKADVSVTVKQPPLEIMDHDLVDDGIGGKDAVITFRNNTTKTVTAIRIRIAMWNNFGERVDYFGETFFSGMDSDVTIGPGNSYQATWSLYWATGVTRIVPWVYEIAYSDGSVWKLYD